MADYSLDYAVTYDADPAACGITFGCFDTENAVTVYAPDAGTGRYEDVLLEVRRRCLEYHRLWSFSSSASDIARINAGEGRIAVDPKTCALIERMTEFNAVEPLFDFTIGPVSYLWKQACGSVPDAAAIKQALGHAGVGKIAVGQGLVEKADPCAQVDVGGAAKGFVADDLAAYLRAQGIGRADIDLGGNLYLLGDRPEGRPWRLEVGVPQGVDAPRTVIEAQDASVVTSGTYERFVEVEGVRYHHVIDPRTGCPSTSDIVSATVVAPSSLAADMLATTALVTGSASLRDLASRHAGCRIVVITQAGAVYDECFDA